MSGRGEDNAVQIIDARPADAAGIRAVHTAAFPTQAEADLVEQAAACGADSISLVASVTTAIVGHLLITPVTIHPTDDRPPWTAVAIGPIGVLPASQRTGIGSALMQAAIKRCRKHPCPAIILLGEPDYYKRFGFVPAHPLGYSCKWDEAGDAFMALQLDPVAVTLLGAGRVTYHAIFDVF